MALSDATNLLNPCNPASPLRPPHKIPPYYSQSGGGDGWGPLILIILIWLVLALLGWFFFLRDL